MVFPDPNPPKKRERLFVPQVQSDIRAMNDLATQYNWLHVGLYEVSIYRTEIPYYLEHPKELVKDLRYAKGLMDAARDQKNTRAWRDSNMHLIHVMPGLHYPTTTMPWLRVDRSNHYLTVTETDPLNNGALIACSHYIRLDVHKQRLHTAKTDVEELVAHHVQSGIERAVISATEETTKSLAEIRDEKARLQDQLARLEAVETRLQEREQQRLDREAEKQARKQSRTRAGYVYLVQSLTALSYYKIGRAAKPEQRMKRFEVKLPFEIQPICFIKTDDMYALEKKLHERFAAQRADGEFFALSDADVAYIKSLSDSPEAIQELLDD